MSETEKITINLGAVDLGQIDLLVEQGFYSNRTDLIRTAIRNQIHTHADELKKIIHEKSMMIGIHSISKSYLETLRSQNKKISLKVVGMLVVEAAVTPELFQEVVEAVHVSGMVKASPAIKKLIQ